MVATDLTCYRGETAEWSIVVRHNTAVVDLTGATLRMTARKSFTSDVVFQLSSDGDAGITIDDADTGASTVKLRVSDTSSLTNEEWDLVYDIRVLTTDGDDWVVQTGTLTVSPTAAVVP